MVKYSFVKHGQKITVVKGLPYQNRGYCFNCKRVAYNRLKNHTLNVEVFLCDDCLVDSLED